jgi:predicted PolB exonuclease-like 3'-5' exonuclease
MFTRQELEKLIYFDIETVHGHKTMVGLSDRQKELWSKRCEYLRERFEDNKDLSDEELYEYKGALHAEYSKIVCVSFGRIQIQKDGEIKFIIKSFSGDDERELLRQVIGVFEKFLSSGFRLCGHNIEGFDMPVILKRAVINGIVIPKALHFHNLKPWEMPTVDTSKVWSFGAWKEGLVSLDLLCASLGIDTPKDDIDGSKVSEVYWKDGDLDRIVKYCEKDVLATTQVMLKLGNQKLIEHVEVQEY